MNTVGKVVDPISIFDWFPVLYCDGRELLCPILAIFRAMLDLNCQDIVVNDVHNFFLVPAKPKHCLLFEAILSFRLG